MKTCISSVVLCLFFLTVAADAYEYPLQITTNSGSRGLLVAGYEIDGTGVTGNCSYYTVHATSGRGGGGGSRYRSMHRRYSQTCRWDLYGNLLSITPGALIFRAPIYTNGTEVVYAHNASGSYTGTDPKLPNGGFVNTPGSHYTWLTPNTYALLQQQVYSFTLTLKSDGDVPLNITAAHASALLAKVAVTSSTCTGAIPVGSTCSVTVSYDPTSLSTNSGLAYDTLTAGVISDAGQTNEFVQSYTVSVSLSNGN